jgi:hypothetical protein
MSWTQQEAIDFATTVEQFAPDYGCHIALTGGCLYGEGERDDADFVFYRIRQTARIAIVGLFGKLAEIGVKVVADYGFVVKVVWNEKPIDFMFPEADRGGEDYGTVAAAEDFGDII